MRKRKNFIPTFVITFLWWTLLGILIYFVDPTTFGAVILFFVLVFLALLFTLSVVFVNSRKGLIASTAITFFLVLRYFGVGNVLNLLFILGVAVAFEIHFMKQDL